MGTREIAFALLSIREAPLGFTLCAGIPLELYLGKKKGEEDSY